MFVADPDIKVFELAIKVLLNGQKPDKTFPLRISDQADKTSEDPDVVLQTLEKNVLFGFCCDSKDSFQFFSPLPNLLCQRNRQPVELLQGIAKES